MASGSQDHPDMSYERERLLSFSHGWQGNSSTSLLASAGFYYTRSGDLVKCFSCEGTVDNWNSKMHPYNVHQERFPNCDLVNNAEHRNKPWIPSAQTMRQVKQAFPGLVISDTSTLNPMGMTIPVVRSSPMSDALFLHQHQVRINAFFPIWLHKPSVKLVPKWDVWYAHLDV